MAAVGGVAHPPRTDAKAPSSLPLEPKWAWGHVQDDRCCEVLLRMIGHDVRPKRTGHERANKCKESYRSVMKGYEGAPQSSDPPMAARGLSLLRADDELKKARMVCGRLGHPVVVAPPRQRLRPRRRCHLVAPPVCCGDLESWRKLASRPVLTLGAGSFTRLATRRVWQRIVVGDLLSRVGNRVCLDDPDEAQRTKSRCKTSWIGGVIEKTVHSTICI